MKILIKGYYGFGNLGDDILMKVAWSIIKNTYQNASVSIFSNFNVNLKGFEQFQDYNHYIFNILDQNVKIIDWTARGNFDLLVDGGGGVYFDHKEGSIVRRLINFFAKRLNTRRLFTFDKVLRRIMVKPARIQFNRRIGLGLGIGPYTLQSRLLYQHLVEIGSTDIFFVRDKTSLKALDEVRFTGQKFLCSDLAFFSNYWLDQTFLIRKERKYSGRVGIVLLDWHEGNTNRFIEFQKFANHIIASGGQATFFSFDENNDKTYINTFEKQFNFITWRPNEIRLFDFLEALASQDVIFSARAHGVILGSILGVPCVCIGTSKKLEEVSKMFIESSSLIQEPISVRNLVLHLDSVDMTYADILMRLDNDLKKNRTLANETLSKLISCL